MKKAVVLSILLSIIAIAVWGSGVAHASEWEVDYVCYGSPQCNPPVVGTRTHPHDCNEIGLSAGYPNGGPCIFGFLE